MNQNPLKLRGNITLRLFYQVFGHSDVKVTDTLLYVPNCQAR